MEEKIVIDASCAVCRRIKWMDGWWAISWLGFHHRLPHHLIFFISFSSSSLLSFESCWGGGGVFRLWCLQCLWILCQSGGLFLTLRQSNQQRIWKKGTNKRNKQTLYTDLYTTTPFSIVCVSRGSTCHLVEKFSSISDVLYISTIYVVITRTESK